MSRMKTSNIGKYVRVRFENPNEDTLAVLLDYDRPGDYNKDRGPYVKVFCLDTKVIYNVRASQVVKILDQEVPLPEGEELNTPY